MIKVQVSDLVDRFRVDRDEMDEHGPTVRYNVAPSLTMPVISFSNGRSRLTAMQWGLVPYWAKDLKATRPQINARIEGILDKPMFGTAVKRGRCLVPAGGFYEWQKHGTSKTPYFIHRRDSELFAFAGIWDEWRGPDGRLLKSYAILTTEPNSLMRPIHDRMPVILPRTREDEWLQTDESKITELLESLTTPPSASEMEAYPVSTLVNSPKNDTAELVEHIKQRSIPTQTGLF